MKNAGKKLLGFLMAIFMASTASAANVAVTADIATSTTWIAGNVYSLEKQIYVLPGASLTIEAGTLVKSTAGVGGSLAVTRGAKIFVNGTASNPVIMTSTNDDLVTWRAAANEWGNLTIMGKALVSDSYPTSNTKDPSGLNVGSMEGLTAAYSGDPNVVYGGNDDNDDSGSIHYLSLRYGGKVVALNNELNGLSLGAIGRATDIDHIDIMNNVDDGIEIWGGTVNLKYLNIWNVGDDSFDFDEGWRGKAQFGLLVQGYSLDAKQGSGVGDNVIEHDGAEDSDAQPVSTSTLYNFTLIGQPLSGDGGTAWRDNARIQHRNAIFMDLGEQLVRPDNVDGDGAQGYGYNGTLTFAQTWTTNAGVSSTVNPCIGCASGDFNSPEVLYTVQTNGKLAEITDSVFFRNLATNAYTEATARGVFDVANNNVTVTSTLDADAPIKRIVRGGVVDLNGNTLHMLPVIDLDPRAANDALTSVATAPADGFFTPAPFRGAFSKDNNWLCGWTAANTYGFVKASACSSNPADPTETIQLTATTSFPTAVGVLYTVEESSDNKNWSPVATLTGNGSTMSVTDLAMFDSAKFYRAIAQ